MVINMINEALDRHNDTELIDHMASVMAGVVKNCKVALEKNQPEVLWGNLGDISQVTAMLRAMKKRNDERAAQAQI